jgi:hypothetical protein
VIEQLRRAQTSSGGGGSDLKGNGSSQDVSSFSQALSPSKSSHQKLDKRTLYENARAKYETFQKNLAQHPQSLPGAPSSTQPTGVLLGNVLVEKLGVIDAQNNNHNTKQFIFPIGYRAKRMLTHDVKATMQINLVCQ